MIGIINLSQPDYWWLRSPANNTYYDPVPDHAVYLGAKDGVIFEITNMYHVWNSYGRVYIFRSPSTYNDYHAHQVYPGGYVYYNYNAGGGSVYDSYGILRSPHSNINDIYPKSWCVDSGGFVIGDNYVEEDSYGESSPITGHNSVWGVYNNGNVFNSGGIDYILVTDSYGRYSYNLSFRNTYSTSPSKSITAKLITGGFALRMTTAIISPLKFILMERYLGIL